MAEQRRKQLTKHFNVREFDCKDGTPVQKRDHAGLQNLCELYLEPLRAKFGPVTVVSGFRTVSHNRKVGGASKSFHVYTIHDGNDQAADIKCARGTPRQWHATLNWLRARKRGGKGGLGLYNTFVHIDMRDYQSNWRG